MVHYKIHPINPQVRILEKTVYTLKNDDGICVYPTDTVYGMGACATNPKAIDTIGRILQKDKKRLFSFICSDFSQISKYVKIDNRQFKLLKRFLPGPYTFILEATNYVPKKVCPKRQTVGIRMPDCPVVRELARMLGEPLANTSIPLPGRERGDPDLIKNAIQHDVDILLDSGILENPIGSTIIDYTNGEPVVLRYGKGDWNE
jgi:tRNA threonylcarbamoyl adenosine modification protein (Sua5/YciO/YrdC/YwlC family)